MMNNEKDAIDTSKLDEILPKYDPLKLNSINLAQNYVSAFNTGMNIYQCVNQLQGYIEWVVKAVNDVVKSWNVQVGESIDQSKAIVRETTTEQFNTEWTNKQPELIEQVNTLTTNQFNEDWGVLENRINTTLETQNTKINSIQTQQTTLSQRMDTFTSLSEGSTTGDAELQDIRVGANGVTYNNAGDAVRGQYSQLKEDLSELESSVLKTVNLINVDELLENKYYDLTNGVLTMGNGKTMSTPLIQVTSGTYYLYTNTSGSQIFSVCIFDANKNFVRNVPPYDFTLRPLITITDTEKYIGITMYNEKINNTALVASRYIGYFKAVGNTKNFIPPHKMLDFSKGNNVLVVDAKGNGDFTTINSALNSITDDSVDNPYTILIYPSVYKEVVDIRGLRHISLIGVNKKDCIIRDDTGIYENSPLRIEGDCLVENLTIIATHDDNPTMPHTGNKAYAIHADDDGEGTTIIRNCILISYQSSAIGAGLHLNQKIIIEDCDLISYTPNASAWDDTSDWTTTPSYGALFVHSATDSNVTNQKLIIKDCMITSANKRVCAFSNSPDGTSNMEIDLINNNFWCADGNDDRSVTEWYNPIYSGRSFGNNIAKFNAN